MFRLRWLMPWRRLFFSGPTPVAPIIADWCISDTALYTCTLTDATLHQWSLVDETRECD